MSNLFKRAAVFTDIHWGLKSNSIIHNRDCEAFVDWFIQEARANNCETGMFLGDWHNHRASINLHTLQFSLRALEKLSAAFDHFFFIPGNHDLYYRDRRDIHGAEWARHLPNITICNDWFQEGDVIIAPWLVGDDHQRIPKMSSRYMFGHFELPGYLMNAMIEMPDHGEIRREDFHRIEHVFTGHFHKRQTKNNITYIGNAFPHNYADADDDERGMMILDWGESPRFVSWTDQPRYRVIDLSKAIDHGKDIFRANMHVRLRLDIDISYEEANCVKETFVKQYNLREVSLMPSKQTAHEEDLAPGDVTFESVDQIVIDQISKIQSEFYDPNLLLKIYQDL